MTSTFNDPYTHELNYKGQLVQKIECNKRTDKLCDCFTRLTWSVTNGDSKVVGQGEFYRAMHYSAKRGLAIACRLSVRRSVTLVDHDHIG